MYLSLAAIMVSMPIAFATGVSAQTDVEALLTQGNDRGATGCATRAAFDLRAQQSGTEHAVGDAVATVGAYRQ